MDSKAGKIIVGLSFILCTWLIYIAGKMVEWSPYINNSGQVAYYPNILLYFLIATIVMGEAIFLWCWEE